MLHTKGDNRFRYLDFQEAEVGDCFFFIRHSPYGSLVKSIAEGKVVDVDDRWVRCTLTDRRGWWRFQRKQEQPDAYLEDDPIFQQLRTTFEMVHRVAEIKKWIHQAEVCQFDEEVCAAIEEWSNRVLQKEKKSTK